MSKTVVLQKDSKGKEELSLLSKDNKFFIFNYLRWVDLVSNK